MDRRNLHAVLWELVLRVEIPFTVVDIFDAGVGCWLPPLLESLALPSRTFVCIRDQIASQAVSVHLSPASFQELCTWLQGVWILKGYISLISWTPPLERLSQITGRLLLLSFREFCILLRNHFWVLLEHLLAVELIILNMTLEMGYVSLKRLFLTEFSFKGRFYRHYSNTIVI